MSTKKMRLELLLAGPPTKKCLFLKNTFEGFVRNNPQLQLNIYYAGSAISVPTTKGYRQTLDKRIVIPMVFINGTPIPKEYHMDIEALQSFINEEFNKGENEWHD
ncbi:MAG TPA: hypothetical protein VMZ29_07750 [Candidatus Bathyarchaeia archaeon]|nr:hypothetical protein [Candidatus Bathyarchaeia archaeon]